MCSHCQTEPLSNHDYDHPGLCCDCYDLSWFPEYLDDMNEDRVADGKKPMPPWTKKREAPEF